MTTQTTLQHQRTAPGRRQAVWALLATLLFLCQATPSQAFIIGSLFGSKREDGRRRFRRAYIEQGKGNGK